MSANARVRDLVRAQALTVRFPVGRGWWGRRVLHAVDGVDLAVREGEVLALVGESGSGKTTLGRALLGLVPAAQGTVHFAGQALGGLEGRALRTLRRDMQIIFQDPFASLDPRMRVAGIVGEGLAIHDIGDRIARAQRVDEMLRLVGLDADHGRRYPHALSGGQRQRVGIARALAVNPRFVVADEPVSSLDVSVQAQILNLLADLRRRLGLTMLFISHNLGVVRLMADRVAVLYLGRVVEVGDAVSLFRHPLHPYTCVLLASLPVPDPDAPRSPVALMGELPSGIDRPSGCVFRTRCLHAEPACAATVPRLRELEGGRQVACHRIEVLSNCTEVPRNCDA